MIRSEFETAVKDAVKLYWPRHSPPPGMMHWVFDQVQTLPVRTLIRAIELHARDNMDEPRPKWQAVLERCQVLAPVNRDEDEAQEYSPTFRKIVIEQTRKLYRRRKVAEVHLSDDDLWYRWLAQNGPRPTKPWAPTRKPSDALVAGFTNRLRRLNRLPAVEYAVAATTPSPRGTITEAVHELAEECPF
jgi:hypothetical protein